MNTALENPGVVRVGGPLIVFIAFKMFSLYLINTYINLLIAVLIIISNSIRIYQFTLIVFKNFTPPTL